LLVSTTAAPGDGGDSQHVTRHRIEQGLCGRIARHQLIDEPRIADRVVPDRLSQLGHAATPVVQLRHAVGFTGILGRRYRMADELSRQ
jgi:hypothetical protein